MPQPLKPPLLLLAIVASIPSAIQLSAPAAPATEIHATVLSIGDGDTLRISHQGLQITSGVACIDATKMAQSPHGQQSRSDLPHQHQSCAGGGRLDLCLPAGPRRL
jgi:endonuclease YncB( thermonuclease family)